MIILFLLNHNKLLLNVNCGVNVVIFYMNHTHVLFIASCGVKWYFFVTCSGVSVRIPYTTAPYVRDAFVTYDIYIYIYIYIYMSTYVLMGGVDFYIFSFMYIDVFMYRV